MKKGLLYLLSLLIVSACSTQSNAQVITTVAGNGVAGYSGDDSAAITAKLNAPVAVALDTFGNLFIAEAGNHCIRKVDTGGIISTIAGNGTPGFSGDGGAATAAQLNRPIGVAVDNSGNVYISDYNNNRIRKVDASGLITTIAGNGMGYCIGSGVPATDASVGGPSQIIIDDSGSLFWAEFIGHVVRKLDAAGNISTFAGICGSLGTPTFGAHANSTVLNNPRGVAKDKYGNVYISDQFDFWVYKVDTSGIIRVYAGVGPLPGGSVAEGDSATHYFLIHIFWLLIPRQIFISLKVRIAGSERWTQQMAFVLRLQALVRVAIMVTALAQQRQKSLPAVWPYPGTGVYI